MKKTVRWLMVAALVMSSASCEYLANYVDTDTQQTLVDNLKPDVTTSGLELRHYPSLEMLGAYYCPKVIGDPLTALGCAIGLGSPPPRHQMSFKFGISVTIANPNEVPIPALSALVALTLFEAEDAEALGAVCISMCSDKDPECDGRAKPGACDASEQDINSWDDFVDAIPGLIIDILVGDAIEEVQKWLIEAGGNVVLDLEFELGIDQALGVFEKTALAYVQDMLAGREPSLTVPVSVEGSVFVEVPALGRIGINYGPLHTDWEIY